MSNGQLTAVLIVSIVMFASVISRIFGGSRYGRRFRHERDEALRERDRIEDGDQAQ